MRPLALSQTLRNISKMENALLRDAILRIGEVAAIEGRKVVIRMDRDKNSSDLLLDGEIVKNASVGSYLEVRKGFLSLIGKIEGERLSEAAIGKFLPELPYEKFNKNARFLVMSLVGYLNHSGRFLGGLTEMPLIGDEAFVLTTEKLHAVHNLKKDQDFHIEIAKTDLEGIPIQFPIDGLFNSHIAIFGNTGSGKSNTLAALYSAMFAKYEATKLFNERTKFLLFDFNGEFSSEDCITRKKTIYSLNTRTKNPEGIPMNFESLMGLETLSVLVEATEKTQKPFIRRALNFYKNTRNAVDFAKYFRNILRARIEAILKMANKDTAFKLLDLLEDIFENFMPEESVAELRDDLEFHSQNGTFKFLEERVYFNADPAAIKKTKYYLAVGQISSQAILEISPIGQFIIFMHFQLIQDLLRYKVQNDHVYPVINRIKSKRVNIEKIFKISEDADFWGNSNLVVINLNHVDIDMKKTIPLLVAKHLYSEHKKIKDIAPLTIIIDEAHNILSKSSFRETEEWKDYRLETFEEIIKEGRKFGVFLTLSSQRPNDISETIISQAHNFFIHQLINERDLQTIGNAVSYIDKITETAIPTLPVGTCIFSGIATPMPLRVHIDELPDAKKPRSKTVQFSEILAPTAVPKNNKKNNLGRKVKKRK